MTKSSIVQRLLDEKKITAEEAVVLLHEQPPFIVKDWQYGPPYRVGDHPQSMQLRPMDMVNTWTYL